MLVEFPGANSAGAVLLRWFRERPGLHRQTLLVSYNSSGPLDVARAKAMGADFFLLRQQSVQDLLTTVRSVKELHHHMDDCGWHGAVNSQVSLCDAKSGHKNGQEDRFWQARAP
jgi:hypothetical protein